VSILSATWLRVPCALETICLACLCFLLCGSLVGPSYHFGYWTANWPIQVLHSRIAFPGPRNLLIYSVSLINANNVEFPL
jgi:hypothetical protein